MNRSPNSRSPTDPNQIRNDCCLLIFDISYIFEWRRKLRYVKTRTAENFEVQKEFDVFVPHFFLRITLSENHRTSYIMSYTVAKFREILLTDLLMEEYAGNAGEVERYLFPFHVAVP